MITATTITTSHNQELFPTSPAKAKQIYCDENEKTSTVATGLSSNNSRSNVSISEHDDYGDDDDIYASTIEFEVSLEDIEHQK